MKYWSYENRLEIDISLLKRWKWSCWHSPFGLVIQSLNLKCSCRSFETGRSSLFSSWEVYHIVSFDVSRGYFPRICGVSTVYPQLRSMKPQNDLVSISTLDARHRTWIWWVWKACGSACGSRPWFAKVWCCSTVADMVLSLISGRGGSDQTAAWLSQEAPWLQLDFQVGGPLWFKNLVVQTIGYL